MTYIFILFASMLEYTIWAANIGALHRLHIFWIVHIFIGYYFICLIQFDFVSIVNWTYYIRIDGKITRWNLLNVIQGPIKVCLTPPIATMFIEWNVLNMCFLFNLTSDSFKDGFRPIFFILHISRYERTQRRLNRSTKYVDTH